MVKQAIAFRKRKGDTTTEINHVYSLSRHGTRQEYDYCCNADISLRLPREDNRNALDQQVPTYIFTKNWNFTIKCRNT